MGTTVGRSMMHTPHTTNTTFDCVALYKENTFRAVFEHKRSFFPRAYVLRTNVSAQRGQYLGFSFTILLSLLHLYNTQTKKSEKQKRKEIIAVKPNH